MLLDNAKIQQKNLGHASFVELERREKSRRTDNVDSKEIGLTKDRSLTKYNSLTPFMSF